MHSINVCVCESVFESLHAIDTFTKRKSVNKQRDKACKQDINQILLDSDSLGFESFGFGILNCPSLPINQKTIRIGQLFATKTCPYMIETMLNF